MQAATGEVVSAEDLGGGDVHTRLSGVADHLAESDAHALAIARRAVASLAPARRAELDCREPVDPRYPADELYGLIPADTRKPYDVHEVIARLVDDSEFAEWKTRYGRTLVTGFAHLWGMPIGIVANNGILFSESAQKGAHFIELCCQRRTPLVFLQNITGFMVGRKVGARRYCQTRRQDGHRRRGRAGSETHRDHRWQLRCRQLCHVRPGLRSALPVDVAECAYQRHGRGAGGARAVHGASRRHQRQGRPVE